MGIFDIKHWLVILLVVVLVFGTKRLKSLGSDLGETIKGFRKSMNSEDEAGKPTVAETSDSLQKPQTIDVQAQKVEDPVRKD